MIKADLHVHSIHSDGTKMKNELVEISINNNVDMIAVTDHDNINIIDDITDNEKIKIIVGTEYSTIHNGENIHLLGFYKKNKPKNSIIKYLKKLENDRVCRAKEMLNRLDKLFDIKLSFDELNLLANGSIGRPHMAKLIHKYYGISEEIIYKKYLGNDSPAYIPSSFQDLKETIDFLHRNDAIAVLAHPIHYKKTNIEEFVELGIDGIECFYPEHKKKYIKKLVKLANENNLVITGGSDFHDHKKYKGENHGEIGDSFIEDEYIKIFLERLEVKWKR